MIGFDVLFWRFDCLAGSDDEWTTVGPEAEQNWLNVSDLETGSEYEFRVVAMNNGANKTASEPTIIYIGARKGLYLLTCVVLLLKSATLFFIGFCSNSLLLLPKMLIVTADEWWWISEINIGMLL